MLGTAVVTGATSGIGRAYARKLAAQGYGLILTGRRAAKLRQTAAEIRRTWRVPVLVRLVELSRPEAVRKLCSELSRHPRIEVLVNNAGFGHHGSFHRTDPKALEKMMYVHVQSVALLTRAVLPGMIRRNQGTVINVSSEAAFFLIAKNTLYGATKDFERALTESLHIELKNTGVKVQALCPGFTRTDFHERMQLDETRDVESPLIRWLTPERVVEQSWKDLSRNQVVSFPAGWLTRLLITGSQWLPRRVYYAIMAGISGKVNQTP